MRRWLAALVLLVAGCSSDEPGADLWSDGVAAAAPSADLGDACALPVRFSIPRGWRATPIPAGTFDVAGAPLTCEISLRPTSHTGAVRVYVDRGGSPAGYLHAFAAAQKAGQPLFRDIALGAELSYLSGPTRHWVFALRAGDAVVAVTSDPFTEGESAQLAAVYVLVKQTVRAR